MTTTTPTTPAEAGISTPTFATIGTSALPAAREAIGGAFEGMRSTRQMSVDVRVANVVQLYEGSNGQALLDSDDIERLSAISGFDKLEGKGGKKGKALSTMEVAAQEAAMLGAMSKDGKLSAEDKAYLEKKYSADMNTTFANNMAGGFGRGVLGMMAGAAVGGFGAFMASFKSNGFFKSAFFGFAGAAAGALGGSMFPKLAEKMKESLGFGLGLGGNSHMAKFDKAMKAAAEKGFAIANEYDLEIGKKNKKDRGRVFGKETEAGVSPAISAAMSASAPAAPAASAVVAGSEITKANDMAIAALGGKDPELAKLLAGFDKKSPAERRAMISDLYLEADTTRGDILSDIDAGRYAAADEKSKAFAKTLPDAPAPMTAEAIDRLVDAKVEAKLKSILKASGFTAPAAEGVEAPAAAARVTPEELAARPYAAPAKSFDELMTPEGEALLKGLKGTVAPVVESTPETAGKAPVDKAPAEKKPVTRASLAAEYDALEAVALGAKGVVASGEAAKGAPVVASATPVGEVAGAGKIRGA